MGLVKLFKLMDKTINIQYVHGDKWTESYLLIELVEEVKS